MKRITVVLTLLAMLTLSGIPSTALGGCMHKIKEFIITSQCDCDVFSECSGDYEVTYVWECGGYCCIGKCEQVGTERGVRARQWECYDSCAGGIENCTRTNCRIIYGPIPTCDCR